MGLRLALVLFPVVAVLPLDGPRPVLAIECLGSWVTFTGARYIEGTFRNDAIVGNGNGNGNGDSVFVNAGPDCVTQDCETILSYP